MRWVFQEPDKKLVEKLQFEFDTSAAIAVTMANRGITSRDSSRDFFEPKLNQLHDPFIMKNMDQAVERILTNIQSGRPIMVFGDYDVDGTTAASILYLSLTDFGGVVNTYIPHREHEGYGLSNKGIDFASEQNIDLIITCDCGINAFEQVDYARERSIDVIITDHHIPDNKLPAAVAILNPNQSDCDYPFKGLCGAGVAFKLACGVGKKLNWPLTDLLSLLDLATLGTSADMVPILDENRVIVSKGLELINDDPRPGLRAILKTSGLLDRDIAVGNLVFGVSPKINAAGRLGDANRSVEILTTKNKSLAANLADNLDEENRRRQDIQEKVVNEALLKANAESDLSRDRAIVLAEYGWHPGVIGIVASRIKEEFHRPTVIIAIDNDGIGKGSARSITGFDLYDALTEASDHLMNYGGHPMAAGLTLSDGKFEDFKKAFLSFAESNLSEEDMEPRLKLDAEIQLNDINSRFMHFLELLGPYGPGNMRPKFAARNLKVVGNPRIIGNGNHIRFRVKQERTSFPAIGFNLSEHYEDLIKGNSVDLAFVVEVNEWRGKSTIQLNLRDIKQANSI